jgi:branched-chain amino acid transport system ATP-binding protein
MTASAAAPVMQCRGLTVRFGGLEALSNLSLDIRAGEVLGIAGPNGAGKTTLFNVISGHVRPVAGEVIYDGRAIVGLSPARIFQRGVARTFQIPEVIATQSIYDNVLVGAHFGSDRGLGSMLRFGLSSRAAADRAVVAYGLQARAHYAAGTAPLFERKMVMLASAMARAPRLLLLDEPAGGLTSGEADVILARIGEIRRGGTTVVVIEHVMRFLMAAADRLVVLNRGTLVFDGSPSEGRRDEAVQRLYFGRTRGS